MNDSGSVNVFGIFAAVLLAYLFARPYIEVLLRALPATIFEKASTIEVVVFGLYWSTLFAQGLLFFAPELMAEHAIACLFMLTLCTCALAMCAVDHDWSLQGIFHQIESWFASALWVHRLFRYLTFTSSICIAIGMTLAASAFKVQKILSFFGAHSEALVLLQFMVLLAKLLLVTAVLLSLVMLWLEALFSLIYGRVYAFLANLQFAIKAHFAQLQQQFQFLDKPNEDRSGAICMVIFLGYVCLLILGIPLFLFTPLCAYPDLFDFIALYFVQTLIGAGIVAYAFYHYFLLVHESPRVDATVDAIFKPLAMLFDDCLRCAHWRV